MTGTSSSAKKSRSANASRRVPKPLRDRLRSLDPQYAQLARRLFDVRRSFAASNGVRLHVEPAASTPAQWVACDVGDEHMLIGVLRDGIVDPCAADAWTDYRGAARCAAWALAHERLLQALCELFGRTLLSREMPTPNDAPEHACLIGFRASAADQHATGVIATSSTLVQALADGLRVRGARDPATARIDPGTLRETLRCTAAGPRLSAEQIADLRLGDVIVLGQRAHVLGDLRVQRAAANVGWSANWQAERLRIQNNRGT